MSTTWTLTRERICDKAMEKCGALGVGETPSAADRSLCLEALDGILKQLAWYGYSWPKITQAQTSITFTANVGTVTLPTDYYDATMVNYVDASGNEKPVTLITLRDWNDLTNKTQTGTYPLKGFIDNGDVLNIWPVPTANVSGKLWYQRIIDDSVASSSVNLDSPWLLGLVYGVAEEIGHEFGVNPARIQFFGQKWVTFRQIAVQNTSSPRPACISVDQ